MDNSLIGEPEIQCGSDTVEMQFRTKNMFTGDNVRSEMRQVMKCVQEKYM